MCVFLNLSWPFLWRIANDNIERQEVDHWTLVKSLTHIIHTLIQLDEWNRNNTINPIRKTNGISELCTRKWETLSYCKFLSTKRMFFLLCVCEKKKLPKNFGNYWTLVNSHIFHKICFQKGNELADTLTPWMTNWTNLNIKQTNRWLN